MLYVDNNSPCYAAAEAENNLNQLPPPSPQPLLALYSYVNMAKVEWATQQWKLKSALEEK